MKGACQPNPCGAANMEVEELRHLLGHSFVAGSRAERCILAARRWSL